MKFTDMSQPTPNHLGGVGDILYVPESPWEDFDQSIYQNTTFNVCVFLFKSILGHTLIY